MKKLMHLLAMVTTCIPSLAQNYFSYPDSGAVWTELIESATPMTPYQYNYITYTLGGDTVIGAYTYKKLTPNGLWPERGAIREDTLNHRIYFAGDCQVNYADTLIYDFNLVVGDTAYTDIGGDAYVVSVVDSVLILGQYRKRIQLASQFGGTDEWITGIGSTNHPLKPLLPMEFEGNLSLMCLQDDTLGIYIRYSVVSNNGPWYTWLHPGNCGLTAVEQNDVYQSTNVSISNDILSVRAPLFDASCNYIISDITGKEVFRTSDTNSTTIDLTGLNPGIYFIQVTDHSGNFFAQKFLAL